MDRPVTIYTTDAQYRSRNSVKLGIMPFDLCLEQIIELKSYKKGLFGPWWNCCGIYYPYNTSFGYNPKHSILHVFNANFKPNYRFSITVCGPIKFY